MVHYEVDDTRLVFVSARKSRGVGFWDKDDYDVRLGDKNGPVVGRIMRHPQAREDQPWFWTITAREQPPSVYNHGYAASREQAMRYFKARYRLKAWLKIKNPESAGGNSGLLMGRFSGCGVYRRCTGIEDGHGDR